METRAMAGEGFFTSSLCFFRVYDTSARGPVGSHYIFGKGVVFFHIQVCLHELGLPGFISLFLHHSHASEAYSEVY